MTMFDELNSQMEPNCFFNFFFNDGQAGLDMARTLMRWSKSKIPFLLGEGQEGGISKTMSTVDF